MRVLLLYDDLISVHSGACDFTHTREDALLRQTVDHNARELAMSNFKKEKNSAQHNSDYFLVQSQLQMK